MKYYLLTACLFTLAWLPASAEENALQSGKKLVETHCISCHASSYGGDGSGIYTREYRKVRSFNGLKAQVTNCNTMLNLKWFDDEEQQVVQYLNHTYYHF
jgi:hypothetical protein